jgi:hypothetical protein
MAMGETTGDAALLSQNCDPYFAQFYTQTMAGAYGVHSALLGDPSLRMNYGTVPPPSNLSVTQVYTPNVGVELKWNAPSTPVAGYYIYKQESNGVLTALNGDAFTDKTTYLDEQLFEGNVRYVVRAVGLLESNVGSFYDISVPIEQTTKITSVEDNTSGIDVSLSCFPNPTNTSTSIVFTMNQPALVNIGIYSVSGEIVRTLENRVLSTGEQHLSWNLKTSGNQLVPSGIYLIRATIGSNVFVQKVAVVE